MNEKQSTVGQDSFLDIIANLVGILIILVIVVGAQAKSEWTQKEQNPEKWEDVERLTKDVLQKSSLAINLKLENDEFESKIAQQAGLMLDLDQQRHEMLVQLAFVKNELKNKSESRNESDRERVAAQSILDNLKIQYSDVKNHINAVEANIVPTQNETIEHYPTPIAKTVFSDEIHFLLSKGKVSYIPMDELLDLMRSEWRTKAGKLVTASQTLETVGPINGFRLQYHLIAEDVPFETSQGVRNRRQTRFDHFDLLPVSSETGEIVNRALRQGSDFDRRLQRLIPEKTTVSIWVYPDSYRELESLKKALRSQGFQIANWPLQFGKLVSGGPNGFRTSAQ